LCTRPCTSSMVCTAVSAWSATRLSRMPESAQDLPTEARADQQVRTVHRTRAERACIVQRWRARGQRAYPRCMRNEWCGDMADLHVTVAEGRASVAHVRRLHRRGGRANSERASRLQAVFGPRRGQRACGEACRAGSGQRQRPRRPGAEPPTSERSSVPTCPSPASRFKPPTPGLLASGPTS
jgi:hypothetical protein